jgi:hypothetical protein
VATITKNRNQKNTQTPTGIIVSTKKLLHRYFNGVTHSGLERTYLIEPFLRNAGLSISTLMYTSV